MNPFMNLYPTNDYAMRLARMEQQQANPQTIQ